MYSTKSQKSKSKKNSIITFSILGVSIVVLFLIFGFALEKTGIIDLYNTSTNQEPVVNNINYDPPTAEEATAGDVQKEIIASDSEEKTSEQASVVIVDASQYEDTIEVRAFVTNIIKDGSCTFTFAKGSTTIEKTNPAYADASSTPCIALSVPRSEFVQSGTWDVTVTYTNESASGSATKTLEIR